MVRIEDLFAIQTANEEALIQNGMLTNLLEGIDEAYQECLFTLREDIEAIEVRGKNMSIDFKPLHGSGVVPVT